MSACGWNRGASWSWHRKRAAACYAVRRLRCSVAAGRVDGYYEQGLAEWDLAAGTLLAREAGARVEELGGGPPLPGGVVVAAHPALWEALADLVRAV